MAATVYYDNDADLSLLKDKVIAILGYGSQGHAHAQNRRDSGCKVVIGQRPNSDNYRLAKEAGFEPVSIEEAVKHMNDWNENDSVLEWTIKRTIEKENTIVVEWYFKCDCNNKVSGFDGVTIADFDENGKIVRLSEFRSDSDHIYPYD